MFTSTMRISYLKNGFIQLVGVCVKSQSASWRIHAKHTCAYAQTTEQRAQHVSKASTVGARAKQKPHALVFETHQ